MIQRPETRIQTCPRCGKESAEWVDDFRTPRDVSKHTYVYRCAECNYKFSRDLQPW